MKRINQFIFLLLVCAVFYSSRANCATGTMPRPFQIIPQPSQVDLLGGRGIKFGELSQVQLSGQLKRPIMGTILSRLTESGKGEGTLTLKLDSSSVVPESKEGYVLTISMGSAEVISRGEAGLFYGCQTLEQILEDARDFHVDVPACKITDFPALTYRAVHFDVKHHLDNMEYYYQSVDRLARYKINAIIFEFEDKLGYQRQPLVGGAQSISIDEMASLTRYARKRHIEISPLVQGLGHATYILKHQEYAHLRELPDNRWTFCPLNEGTYQVLFDLYRDAIAATPGSRYLHVGGDETGNIGLCTRCKPMGDKEGVIGLNLYWLKRVCEFAKENNRIPIFWDDMPLKEAGVYRTTYDESVTQVEAARIWKDGGEKLEQQIDNLPENGIFMRWNYGSAREPGNEMAMDWYQEHGLKVMVATAAQSNAALFPYDDRTDGALSGVAAIQSFLQLAARKHAEGMLCTAWDDKSPHMETYWRGFIASAEYSWSERERTLDQFDIAYLQREFGFTIGHYANFYAKLRKAAGFWEKAYDRKGDRLDIENALIRLPGLASWLTPAEQQSLRTRTNFSSILIQLPDLKHPGEWSKMYSERLNEAETISKEYRVTSKELSEFYEMSKRNRYHWKLFAALNDFQVTAPHLLLALKLCDTSDTVKRRDGIEAVDQALNEFSRAWKNLKQVYLATRFTTYPSFYVLDRYSHYASRREDLSWMIQEEELFQQMISKWRE